MATGSAGCIRFNSTCITMWGLFSAVLKFSSFVMLVNNQLISPSELRILIGHTVFRWFISDFMALML